LTDISEYGDVMINAYLDEWGRRKIDSLLEDGTRILIAVAAPIIKTWTALLNTSHVFTRPIRFMKLTQALNISHVYLRHRFMRLSQTLKTLHAWTLPIPTFLKQWFAALQTVHVFSRPFRRIGYTQQLQPTHVFSSPIRLIRFPAAVQTVHLFSAPTRLVRLVEPLALRHVYFVAVPAVRKTRLFLVVDSLAIQLTGG